MASTPTARNYDLTRIHQGPGDLWFIGATGPADGASPKLTLAYDGSPDSTANPNALHLGGTESSISFSGKNKQTDIKLDQFSGPVDYYLAEEGAMLEATMAQLDPKLMQNADPGMTYSVSSTLGMVTKGGLLPPFATGCYAAIWHRRKTTNGVIVAMLFMARGSVAPNFSAGREKPSSWKITIEGMSDVTRANGRQMAVFYEDTLPSS